MGGEQCIIFFVVILFVGDLCYSEDLMMSNQLPGTGDAALLAMFSINPVSPAAILDGTETTDLAAAEPEQEAVAIA